MEVLIALMLVSAVALAATDFEVVSRRYFLLDRRRSTLTNEAAVGLERITRTVRYSMSLTVPPRPTIDGGGRLVLRADNADGTADDTVVRTPIDLISDNRDVSYRLAGGQLLYDPNYPAGPEEVVAQYVNAVAFAITTPAGVNCAGPPDCTVVTTTITTTTQGEQPVTLTSTAAVKFKP